MRIAKNIFWALLLIMMSSANAVGQTGFYVEDSLLAINKTTNFGVVHGYLEVFNDTNVDVPMRWKCIHDNKVPNSWVLNIDDQNQNYLNVQDGDSADFDLYAGTTFPPKIIIGVEHNGMAGTGIFRIRLYSLWNQADSFDLVYNVNIAEATVISTDPLENTTQFYFSQNKLWVQSPFTMDKLTLYSITGERVWMSIPGGVNSGSYDVSGICPGLYILKIDFPEYPSRTSKLEYR